MKIQNIPIPNSSIQLDILRIDKIHPYISGNKWFKLKYNLQEAKLQNKNTLLTFGGAYSNHIHAVAFAGKEQNFNTIGIIRGEEIAEKWQENPTLQEANALGMRLYFVNREEYRLKENGKTAKEQVAENIYIIPEGGTNTLAIEGTKEIITSELSSYDYIACAVGTGGTIAGLSLAAFKPQKILGFPALKNASFLYKEIEQFSDKKNFSLLLSYHFGGYGKVSDELIAFINHFQVEYHVPLEPIYTGKMMFGLFEEIKKNTFPIDAKIIAIHTGGLQGIKGMNIALKQKNITIKT